jgi:hypothetical protein
MTPQRAERAAWAIGGIGGIGAAIGWLVAPAEFPHAWLAALTAWLGWPLGCMGLVLVHALTGGRWGHTLRPQLIAGMITLPLLLPALVPLLIVLPALYPWARAETASQLHNQFYLNLPFFAGRGILYLIVWFGLGGLILRALRGPDPERGLARLAPAGLILLAMTVTYAAIDTTMSLDPQFASSAYGLIAIAEMGLLALAVSMFAATFNPALDEDSTESLGRLLQGLVVLWAYLDFMQVLIVWQSDLATEAPWYVLRTTGGWGVVAGGVAAGHFILPFFALLLPGVRRSRRGIAIVTALLILSAVVRSWWLVVPASGRGFAPDDVLAMLGLLGIAAAVALRAPSLPAMAEAVRRHG